MSKRVDLRDTLRWADHRVAQWELLRELCRDGRVIDSLRLTKEEFAAIKGIDAKLTEARTNRTKAAVEYATYLLEADENPGVIRE